MATTEQALTRARELLEPAIGSVQFCALLTELVTQEAQADHIVLLSYHYQLAPQIIYEAGQEAGNEPEKPAQLIQYLSGGYLFSPYYRRWQAQPQRADLCQLNDIAPQGFYKSDYYAKFYARSNRIDELAFLAPVTALSAAILSLSRSHQFTPFTSAERDRLQLLAPIINSSIARHMSLQKSSQKSGFESAYQQITKEIGSPTLTRGERDLLELILLGHSADSCASNLAVTAQAESLARAIVHEKLKVSTQADLFSAVFEKLRQAQRS